LKNDSKVKGSQKKTMVTSDNIGHLQIKSELPLKNGCTCVLVEKLTTIEEGHEILMHQVGTIYFLSFIVLFDSTGS
jgi:hypothetical protein